MKGLINIEISHSNQQNREILNHIKYIDKQGQLYPLMSSLTVSARVVCSHCLLVFGHFSSMYKNETLFYIHYG